MQSILSISKTVKELTEKGKLNQALVLVHDAVEKVFTEPLCTSQVYGSKKLDQLCQKIGNINLNSVSYTGLDLSKQRISSSTIVYIVTKLQKSGGHTRVISDFIAAQPTKQHLILSTELSGSSDDACLEKFDIERAPKGNFQKKLTWLQRRLIELTPEKVYLFNHHQDSVAAAAIQPEMNLDGYFYHHGDHHLCLGLFLGHLKHIDPNPASFASCRHEFEINNCYIPLTVADQGPRAADFEFMSAGRLTTCTAARSNKVEIPYFVSYLDLIPELIVKTGGRHIHIGRLSPWGKFRLERNLKKHGINPQQFIYIPWVPSVWKALHEWKVDLYIASFPYGGALTLIEAMGAGVPLVIHKHIFSRILSCIDIAYPGASHWQDPNDLISFCQNANPDDLRRESESARSHYEKFHHPAILAGILNSKTGNNLPPEPSNRDYSIGRDELAIWIEQQVTLSHLISRWLYRLLRKLRARLSW